MNKKYITITKDDGSLEKMEILTVFKLEDTGKDYVFYKDDLGKFYAASYGGDLEFAVLDTNLTDEEKEKLNNVFSELYIGGEVNA